MVSSKPLHASRQPAGDSSVGSARRAAARVRRRSFERNEFLIVCAKRCAGHRACTSAHRHAPHRTPHRARGGARRASTRARGGDAPPPPRRAGPLRRLGARLRARGRPEGPRGTSRSRGCRGRDEHGRRHRRPLCLRPISGRAAGARAHHALGGALRGLSVARGPLLSPQAGRRPQLRRRGDGPLPERDLGPIRPHRGPEGELPPQVAHAAYRRDSTSPSRCRVLTSC